MLVRGFEIVFDSFKRSHNHGLNVEQWRKIKHVNAPLPTSASPGSIYYRYQMISRFTFVTGVDLQMFQRKFLPVLLYINLCTLFFFKLFLFIYATLNKVSIQSKQFISFLSQRELLYSLFKTIFLGEGKVFTQGQPVKNLIQLIVLLLKDSLHFNLSLLVQTLYKTGPFIFGL